MENKIESIQQSIASSVSLWGRVVQEDWQAYVESQVSRFASSAKFWTGLTDLEKSVEKIRKKEYQSAAWHLVKGSLHVLALSAAVRVFFLSFSSPRFAGNSRRAYSPATPQAYSPATSPAYAQNCYSYRNLGSIPDVQPALEYNYCEKEKKPITFVTAYNEAIKDYAEPILENQRAYAEKHKYCYVVYKGDLAHDDGNPRAPYWSKIVAIWDQSKKVKPGSWIVWVDASAIFTNTQKTFGEIIQKYGRGKKDVIVTDEPQVPINNAVFALKKDRWTKDWIQKVWSRCDLSQGGEGRCGGSKQDPDCHFEQEAMTGLWEDNQDVKDHTSLISNRNMNSFYRFSHNNPNRNDRYLNYNSDDKERYHWHNGDLICKVTGMAGHLRTKMTQLVLDNCIDKECTLPQTEKEVLAYQRPHENLRKSTSC